MLIDSGGGGTDWSTMSMDMMWLLITTPDTEAYYNMLDGWKRSYELLNAHKWQVASYRDALATAWPPKTNGAADAYVTRLNEMLDNLDQTYEAAIHNHRAFADATLSIGLAQSDFAKLYQEYSSNQTLLNAFESKMAADTTSTEKSTPPVADGRQEALRQQAAIRLSSVSTDLAQAQAQIRQPVKYDMPIKVGDTGHPNDGPVYTPPMIPPITPSYPESDNSTARSTRPSVTFPTTGGNPSPSGGGPTASTPVFTNPGTTPPLSAQPTINPQQPGLILGGTGGPIAPQPAITPTPPQLPSSTTGPLTQPVLPTGTGPFATPRGTSVGSPRSSTGRVQGFSAESAARSGGITEGMRAMPPGGLIGGPSGKGGGQPGQARTGMRQVNPVGGMIGGGEPSTRPSTRGVSSYGENVAGGRGAAGRTSSTGGPGQSASERAGRSVNGRERSSGVRGAFPQPVDGMPGGRRPSNGDPDESTRWDPDNPWETAEGVDPVLMPAREQRIDPGPAIGLP